MENNNSISIAPRQLIRVGVLLLFQSMESQREVSEGSQAELGGPPRSAAPRLPTTASAGENHRQGLRLTHREHSSFDRLNDPLSYLLLHRVNERTSNESREATAPIEHRGGRDIGGQ